MARPGDEQPTALSDAAQAGAEPTRPAGPAGPPPALAAPSEAAAKVASPSLPPEVARRTGVLLVHGIGTQAPSETFLDWSTPIVELLTDWQSAQRGDAMSAPGEPDRIDDRLGL